MPHLTAWANFYQILGSSAGALIGLQFVVMALIASRSRRIDAHTTAAFGTPTVVHFASALTLAAIMSVPWPSLVAARIALAVCGLAGITYGALAIRHARLQTVYEPVGEDWFWHMIFPVAAYAVIALAAASLARAPQGALFAVGGATLSLLFIGIHNAWDTVTYVLSASEPKRE